jgi:diadenosine tetraphosphate (Ap4A) HIT family hydrolase
MAHPKCQGCKKARDSSESVSFPGGWSLSHYGGCEGFLGWLALQTREHRRSVSDLSVTEAKALGPLLRRLERGTYKYWRAQRHPVERVYVMYFLEGALEPGGRDRWHLHFHLVPRFVALRTPMRGTSGIDAYQIAKLRPQGRLPAFLDSARKRDPAMAKLQILRGVVAAAD